MKDNDNIFLIYDPPVINEATDDPRMSVGPDSWRMGADMGTDAFDWRIWQDTSFGRTLTSRLRSSGLNVSVFDAGKTLSVTAGLEDSATGKTVTKTFIVVFAQPKKKGDLIPGYGKIWNSSTKFRTFSNIDQVANYVSSYVKSLVGVVRSR